MKSENKIGRNNPCHCGSSKKYKKCCMDDDKKETEKEDFYKTIDPSVFISKPYTLCPNCGKNEFGLLSVYPRRYSKRCKECWHTDHFDLPVLKKKIIYLDQMAISNIANSLNKKSKSFARLSKDTYWVELFKRLDKLCKYQAIVCPESCFHEEESLLSSDFESMKMIYEHLSCDANFLDHKTIMRFQIDSHLKNYLDGKPEIYTELDTEHIIMGDIHKWHDKLRVSITRKIKEDEIVDLKETKNRLYDELKLIFQRWQSNNRMEFKDMILEEAFGIGKGSIKAYFNYVQEVVSGKFDFPPSVSALILNMKQAIRSRHPEMNENELFNKIIEYFNSPHILHVPYVKLSSMLFASIARKVSAGQKKLPTPGIFTDVDMVASVLPYCDAVFIDKENAGFLKELTVGGHINYPTKVFSSNNRQEFLDYLDDILDNLSQDHINTVKDVYGEDWGSPFLTILDR